jgi:hypothetical protein
LTAFGLTREWLGRYNSKFFPDSSAGRATDC